MSATETTVLTVSDLQPALDFLAAHPTLPVPRGVDVGYINGALALSAFLHTSEQASAWAEAIGAELAVRVHEGSTHHSTYTFDPFYISASAIVPGESA